MSDIANGEATADHGNGGHAESSNGRFLTGASVGLMLATLFLVNVFNFMDRQLPFILAESIKRDLRLSDTELGLLTGLAFLVCYSLAALPLARLADRWSAKRTMAIVITLWSAMTLLGGVATNFLQLSLTRIGVAIGEAGSTPAAHALIQRAIAPGRRGLALGIFQMGTPAGMMLGMAIGGWLDDAAGWRTAMLAAGALGFVVVLLVVLTVPDARRVEPVVAAVPQAGYGATLRTLFTSRAFIWMFVAMCLVGATVYPTMVFSTPFLIRIHGFTTAQAGLALGLLQGVLGMLGTIIGGVVFDRSLRGARRTVLLWPALSFFVSGPMALGGWFVADPGLALVLLAPIGFSITFYFPAMYGSAHIIAGPGNHATASSLLIIASGLIGGAMAPIAVGMISDGLAVSLGAEAIRYALILVPATAVLAGGAFMMANRCLAEALNGQPDLKH